MWADAKRNGTSQLAMREIDAIIAEVRSEQAAEQKTEDPAKRSGPSRTSVDT
jgi:hypothetical protein